MPQTVHHFRCENAGFRDFFNRGGSTLCKGYWVNNHALPRLLSLPVLLEARRLLRFPPDPLQMLLQSEVKDSD